ncbi:hypothetical protein BDB01DRAFT_782640 [Pilobolus umbonatus]|nr:hypothetical protein BDB01DRAFT_782640 [Pilobolus umbonatus]
MLQSHIINVLPRHILATLWATQETRISISHLIPSLSNQKDIYPNQHSPSSITSPSFICNELPVRYTHILRLLATLTPDTLQSPIIKNVAHSYLHDICTLLHPSLRYTTSKAFTKVMAGLRQSQSANLIRLRYALLSSPTAVSAILMDNINTIAFGIHLLLEQHISWNEGVKNYPHSICPVEIAYQASIDATKCLADTYGNNQLVPPIAVIEDNISKTAKKKLKPYSDFNYIPSLLHRILYESCVLSLKAHIHHQEDVSRNMNWFQRKLNDRRMSRSISLNVFGGPTSVGFRLETPAPLLNTDLLPDIPRDPLGIPTCGSILHDTSATIINNANNTSSLEWDAFSGWRSSKILASHFGGNLDAVTVDGLGSTIYLALDRDPSLSERYPLRSAFTCSADSPLHHYRRASILNSASDQPLSIQAAAAQLNSFLYAITDNRQSTFNPTPLYHHHSVSLNAAVGHA